MCIRDSLVLHQLGPEADAELFNRDPKPTRSGEVPGLVQDQGAVENSQSLKSSSRDADVNSAVVCQHCATEGRKGKRLLNSGARGARTGTGAAAQSQGTSIWRPIKSSYYITYSQWAPTRPARSEAPSLATANLGAGAWGSAAVCATLRS